MDGGAQAPEAAAADRRLWLARHGQTAYNLEGRFQGWLPVPLDETGRAQAGELAEVVAAARARRRSSAATSPARRRRRGIVGARVGLEPVVDARFAETETGDWTDRTFADVIAEDPDGFARFVALDPDWGFPGGRDVRRSSATRVLRGLADWRARRGSPGTSSIVCHGNTIRLATVGARRPRPRPPGQREPRRAVTRLAQVVFGVLVAQRVRGVLRRAAAEVVPVRRPALQGQVPGGLPERGRAARPPARDVPPQARRHRRRRDRRRPGRRGARARVGPAPRTPTGSCCRACPGTAATTTAGPVPRTASTASASRCAARGAASIVPRSFRVDRTPPAPRILSIGPDPGRGPELLPHRDGAPARIRLSARRRAPAGCSSSACGRARRGRSPRPAIPDGARPSRWDGTDDARRARSPPAPYLVVAEVRDKAGNIGTSVPLDRARPARARRTAARCPAAAGSPSAASPSSRRCSPAAPAAAASPLGTDARGKPYTWTVRRTGRRRQPPRHRRAARSSASSPRRTRSGVYLYTARRGPARGDRAVRRRRPRRATGCSSSCPMMTWQGRNPVDDDGDGRPNLLGDGLPVRLRARVRHADGPRASPSAAQPLLAWLDRERHRYDITTDVALATGVGPQLARAQRRARRRATRSGSPPRLQRRLRAFVTARRDARLRRRRVLPAPGAAHAAPAPHRTRRPPATRGHLRRAGRRPLRTGVFDLTAGTDRSACSAGTSGRFTGYSVAEETSSPGTGKVLASAVDGEGAVIIVALRVGRGTVIRFGLPELPCRIAHRP